MIGQYVKLPESVVEEYEAELNNLGLNLKKSQKSSEDESSSEQSENNDNSVSQESSHEDEQDPDNVSVEAEDIPSEDDQDVAVDDSFAYFDDLKQGYENYLKNVPAGDPRHDIFNTFNNQYNNALTNEGKIDAINAVLTNTASVKALKTETHGERFIHAMKVILSILTCGLGAIGFAIHSNYKYRYAKFGNNSGAVFVNKCNRFVDFMTTTPTQEDDESYSM